MEFKLDDKEGLKKILEQRVQENLASKNAKAKTSTDTNTEKKPEQPSKPQDNPMISEPSSNSNYILYVVVAILIIVSFYLGITLSKNNTPAPTNANYITQDEYNAKTQELLTTIQELKESIKAPKPEEPKKEVAKPKQEKHAEPIVIKEEIKPQVVIVKQPKQIVQIEPVIETISGDTFVDYEPISSTNEYNLLKCYEEKVGSFVMPDKCIDNMKKFVADNKNASKFEIIGVVNDDDKIYLKSFLKDNATPSMVEFSAMGLSRHRVVEATWRIKEILGDDSKIGFVNYTINSKVSRGFVVRAYK
ncbi:MAG: hypothetical protein WHU93_04670 [Arcobacteraceae bacterium]